MEKLNTRYGELRSPAVPRVEKGQKAGNEQKGPSKEELMAKLEAVRQKAQSVEDVKQDVSREQAKRPADNVSQLKARMIKYAVFFADFVKNAAGRQFCAEYACFLAKNPFFHKDLHDAKDAPKCGEFLEAFCVVKEGMRQLGVTSTYPTYSGVKRKKPLGKTLKGSTHPDLYND